MANNSLRKYTWDLWVDNQIFLQRYDFNELFGEDDFNDGVTDEEIKHFLENVIYQMVPNVKKKKFTLDDEDKEPEYVRVKSVSFDVDGFLSERYTIHRNTDLTVQDNIQVLKEKKVSPLERAYENLDKKGSESAYVRLFGHSRTGELLAKLVTATQSATISQGLGLEDLIYENYSGPKMENISVANVLAVIGDNPNESILFKKVIISSSEFEDCGIDYNRQENLNLDFLFYSRNILYIRELKDGYNLDTKKSDAEITELKMMKDYFSIATPYECNSGIILWSLKDKKNASIKVKDVDDFINTGIEWSELIDVDYEDIVHQREELNKNNLLFALNKLSEILEQEKIIV